VTLESISDFLRSLWGLWLMVVFVSIVAWAYWPRNKDKLEAHADIPLRDDENKER
jgi:cytochrome c oxidase cbb3-type subunit 4